MYVCICTHARDDAPAHVGEIVSTDAARFFIVFVIFGRLFGRGRGTAFVCDAPTTTNSID